MRNNRNKTEGLGATTWLIGLVILACLVVTIAAGYLGGTSDGFTAQAANTGQSNWWWVFAGGAFAIIVLLSLMWAASLEVK